MQLLEMVLNSKADINAVDYVSNETHFSCIPKVTLIDMFAMLFMYGSFTERQHSTSLCLPV